MKISEMLAMAVVILIAMLFGSVVGRWMATRQYQRDAVIAGVAEYKTTVTNGFLSVDFQYITNK